LPVWRIFKPKLAKLASFVVNKIYTHLFQEFQT